MSPIKDRRAPAEQRSPARVLLGIDKGLRAQDVSLKRASSTRTASAARTLNSQLSRSNSARTTARDSSDPFAPRPKTFGARVAEARSNEKESQAKQERINMARSRGFGLGRFEPGAAPQHGAPRVQSGITTSKGTQQATQARASDDDQKRFHVPSLTPGFTSSGSNKLPRENGNQNALEEEAVPGDEPDSAVSTLEAYTGFHLSKRKIDHKTLTRTLQGKSVYSIPRLLKEVKSPDYDPPDCESDYVVLGNHCVQVNPTRSPYQQSEKYRQRWPR